VLLGGFRLTQSPVVPVLEEGVQYSNTKELGIILYTEYLYPLEIAAVILLVAIVAAIALTLRERKDSKAQDPSEQVKVKASDRLQLVKMAPVRQELPTQTEEGNTP
jgi:NADH-quinone oxidoreductase subunit J